MFDIMYSLNVWLHDKHARMLPYMGTGGHKMSICAFYYCTNISFINLNRLRE